MTLHLVNVNVIWKTDLPSSIIHIMTQEVLISLLNRATNGNELLAILDALTDQEGEEVSPFV